MAAPATNTSNMGARLLLLVGIAAYLWIFLPFLPSAGIPGGHDYALHLPNMLAGEYWFRQNGPFAVPWFSPAHCAGVPYLADLNTAYYALPQWASFLLGPTTAVRASFVLFAFLGASGFYALLRARFTASPWAAAVAALLFMFSGFFTYRMILGHLTFHPYALAPWLAWAVLADGGTAQGRLQRVWPALAGGVMFAYMFHAGMVHGIAPLALSVAVIVLLHGERHGHRLGPWLALAGAAALALALSAQRLFAALAFLQNFPRNEYPLPGFANLFDALRIALQALFWRPPAAAAQPLLANMDLPLEQHEWEYGLGPAAALLLLAALASVRWRARRWPSLVAMALVLALPLVLNWYQPAWHAFLKSQPLLGSSSNLVRWFALYIPIVALGAGLAIDRVLKADGQRALVAVGVALATIAWNWSADRDYYRAQGYDPAAIENAWRAVNAGAPVPAITTLSVRVDKAGQLAVPIDRNDDLARGYSQLLCYQPMFGYGLERLPFGALRPGPALADVGNGSLNLKNPACYLFPAANGCVPGGHFRVAQRAAAEDFLRYRPFPFERPTWQRAADAVTILALLAVVAALALAAVLRWRRRASERATPGSR